MPSRRSRGRVQRSAAGVEVGLDASPGAGSSRKAGQRGMRGPPLAVVEAGPDLPAQLTSFVGRERAIADLGQLLRDARLVTLVGGGGVGKTRLALELVARRRRRSVGGAWLVDLAAIGEGALVVRAIASRLGLREQIGSPLEATLVAYLKARSALLLLDNCEHLIDATAQVVETLLSACPDLRILATSREPFDVPGEHVYPVPPLSLPEPDLLHDDVERDAVPEQLARFEAVALFLDRAVAATPDFRLTPSNAPAVVRICRFLDGLPLAIELTAARLKAFSVDQIADRLGERFWLVTGASRTTVPRHRTLEASVDWSYELLSTAEQALLRTVSVFVGGFAEEAVERVASRELRAASDPPTHSRLTTHDSPLAVLAQLIGKSLVILEERGGRARYRLLETIRQYGVKKLREAGEEDLARRRHAAYYTALAHRAEPELFSAGQRVWFDRFEIEHDNFRVALDWVGAALERGDHDVGPSALEAGAALGWFWIARGYYSEGWRRLPQLLRLTGPSTRTPARVIALHHASACCYILGDRAPIGGLLGEAVSLGHDLGYARGTAMALKGLGVMAHEDGDPERAARLYDDGLAVARRAGDTVATYLLLIWRSDLDRARGLFDHAAELLEESLQLTREQGDHWWMGHALARLGHLALLRGDYARATALAREGLNRRWELNDRQGAAWNLELLAWVAGALGHAERATRLLGAAQAARERTGARLLPQEQDGHERTQAAARRALGEEAFAAAWAEGHTRPPDRAVEYALAVDRPGEAVSTTARTTAPDGSPNDRAVGGLTARELEVAALIARGCNNREIAEQLVVARGTVANHVAHILDKLGFHSRTQIAGWAVERQLGRPAGR